MQALSAVTANKPDPKPYLTIPLEEPTRVDARPRNLAQTSRTPVVCARRRGYEGMLPNRNGPMDIDACKRAACLKQWHWHDLRVDTGTASKVAVPLPVQAGRSSPLRQQYQLATLE